MRDPGDSPPRVGPTQNVPPLSAGQWMGFAGGLGGVFATPQSVKAAADAAMTSRIDAFMQRATATYKVNGVEVKVPPFFRLGWNKPPDGFHIPSGVKQDQAFAVLGLRGKAFNLAVHNCVYGRASPEELRIVTQALIDKGKLDEVRKKYDAMTLADFQRDHGNVTLPLSDANAIKMLQWDYGLGMDCGGYVQQAFLDAHGGSRTKDWGFAPNIGDEALYELAGNSHFNREMTPVHAHAGDLIIMKPPAGQDAGHTVLVRDRHELTSSEAGALTNLGAFQHSGDKVHRIEVDASWGANNGNLDRGGVQTRVFLYNETSGKWADVDKGAVTPQPVGPYGGHPIEGVYHPKK